MYLEPVGILSGGAAEKARAEGQALPLAGGPLAFTGCLRLDRRGKASYVPVPQLEGSAEPLTSPRPAFAGLAMGRPHIMGVLNVTPDSFSDGGDFLDPEKAVAHGVALLEAGAAVIDVGGESTRPGAAPVSPGDEIARVVPVVRALAERGARVSIDTRHASVMAEAVAAGAAIINDVSALTGDKDSLKVAAQCGVPVILMHMQGDDPRTMQAEPRYDFAPLDVYDHLAERVKACRAAGIESLCIDPGIGFGKTVAHNVEILTHLTLLHGLGLPILLGVSRKSFIGKLSRDEGPKDRLPGSLAAALDGVGKGVQMVRVHDVAETVQALVVWGKGAGVAGSASGVA